MYVETLASQPASADIWAACARSRRWLNAVFIEYVSWSYFYSFTDMCVCEFYFLPACKRARLSLVSSVRVSVCLSLHKNYRWEIDVKYVLWMVPLKVITFRWYFTLTLDRESIVKIDGSPRGVYSPSPRRQFNCYYDYYCSIITVINDKISLTTIVFKLCSILGWNSHG